MISKTAAVFIKSKAINQALCPFLAARQRATPFHGIVHRTISPIKIYIVSEYDIFFL